jgi:hypothetical protein
MPSIDRGLRGPRDLEDLLDLVEQYGVYVVGWFTCGGYGRIGRGSPWRVNSCGQGRRTR